MTDQFEQQAEQAIARLAQSPYSALIARGEPAWGVVHQDYGWSNGQIGDGGVWIIDLDGVAYDLPIRDLRKLITSTMDDMGVWDTTWMKGMIDAYSQANRIESDLMQVLLVDMSLPNEFYKHVKDCVIDPVTALNPELTDLLVRLEQTDATKWQALRELGLDAASTPARRKGGRGR
jgi:spore coat protein SA